MKGSLIRAGNLEAAAMKFGFAPQVVERDSPARQKQPSNRSMIDTNDPRKRWKPFAIFSYLPTSTLPMRGGVKRPTMPSNQATSFEHSTNF